MIIKWEVKCTPFVLATQQLFFLTKHIITVWIVTVGNQLFTEQERLMADRYCRMWT